LEVYQTNWEFRTVSGSVDTMSILKNSAHLNETEQVTVAGVPQPRASAVALSVGDDSVAYEEIEGIPSPLNDGHVEQAVAIEVRVGRFIVQIRFQGGINVTFQQVQALGLEAIANLKTSCGL
jgi:hypothetical protein